MADVKEKSKSDKTKKNSVNNLNVKNDANSEGSRDNDDVPQSKDHDIYDELKSFYYRNILKFEQQYNSGLSSSVNNLNDFEIKEIVANIEYYVNLCINSIKDSNLNKKNPSEDHHYQEKSKTLFHSIDDYKNDIINIKSLISYDLIHYGLKAGETH
jgi:hypothetical protein